jgi:hypothetical protein
VPEGDLHKQGDGVVRVDPLLPIAHTLDEQVSVGRWHKSRSLHAAAAFADVDLTLA